MYSHCIFCHAPLGANRSVEAFQVGNRLAFDERVGRLWVICNACRRWNLSPLEERWEVIEQCERLFRNAVRRVSTDQIGMAVLPEGLELVRIGQPLRPELAAWRYGNHLLKRRRDHFLKSSLPGMVLMGANVLALPVLGLLMGPFMIYSDLLRRRVVLRANDTKGVAVRLRQKDAKSLRLLPGAGADGWFMEAHRGDHIVRREGEEAIQLAGRLLPHINVQGADKRHVEWAVRYIEKDGTGGDFFRAAAATLAERRGALLGPQPRVASAPDPLKLALEMAAHEDVERRAMQGELATLESAWREAEEIAAIADQLLLPRVITDKLRQLRGNA